MKGKFLRALALLLCISTSAFGTATDVSSSKNEVRVKGASPHVFFDDDDGHRYTFTNDGGVLRVNDLDGNAFFNVPPTGTIGIELNSPTSVTATPQAGGSLTASTTYYFVVTALDGFGETAKSSEVTCLTTVTNKKCHIAWAAVSPPAQSYRVYMGTAGGLEDHYATVAAPTVTFDATSSPLATPGTPPAVTTAYFIRMAPDGIHFSDGSVQSSAGGAAAWQVPPSTTNIINAQSGNIGLGTGAIFVPDAKLTVLGVIDVNDFGALKAFTADNMQMRSNYKSSTDRLWNTGLSSWAVVAGDGGDNFAVFRAPATAGAPVYAQLLQLTSSTFSSKVFNATFGPSTASAGAYTFQGSNVDVNLSAGSGGTASLNLTVNGGKGAVISADGANTQFDFTGTLSFNAPVGGGQVASIGPGGGIFGNAFLTTNGSVSAAGDIVSTSSRIRGAGMQHACATNGVFLAASGSNQNFGPPTSITAGGNNKVYVVATFVGYKHDQNANQKVFRGNLLRDNAVVIDSGDDMINNVVDVTDEKPVGFTLQSIDTPSAGAHSYNLQMDATAGTWNGNNYLVGTIKICAYEIP